MKYILLGIVLIQFILTSPGNSQGNKKCVNPKYEFGPHCYDHSSTGLAWNDAWVTCVSNGGRLASILDAKTGRYITNNIMKGNRNSEVWLSAVEHYSPWKWVRTGEPLLRKVGCYKVSDSDLGAEDFTIDAIIPEKCVQKCLGNALAFIQGTKCWCKKAKAVGSSPKVNDNECATPCSGDVQLKCGGDSTVHVYNTNETEGTFFDWTVLSFKDGFNCAAYDVEIKGWVNATCNRGSDYGYACEDKGGHIELYDDSSSWFEARSRCAEIGQWWDLAKIDNAAFNKDIATKATLRRKTRFWIGATNREWNWISRGESVIYSNWYGGYPQGEHKSCMVMKRHIAEGFKGHYSWENADCNGTKPFICQYNMFKTPTTPTPSTTIITTIATTTTTIPSTTTVTTTPTSSAAVTTTTTKTTDAVTTSTTLPVKTTSLGSTSAGKTTTGHSTQRLTTIETTRKPNGDTGVADRQEGDEESSPLTMIIAIIVASLVAIIIVIAIIYAVYRKRALQPYSNKEEKSVHFSQNPLYKSSDDAEDEHYGTREDQDANIYDLPPHLQIQDTNSPTQQPSKERYSVESCDLPTNYVTMSMDGSQSNGAIPRDSTMDLTDGYPEVYVSSDQLDGEVQSMSNPLYDHHFPENK